MSDGGEVIVPTTPIPDTTSVAAPIAPPSLEDVSPSHFALFGHGGFRSLQNVAERNNPGALPLERREVGMVVYTEDEDTYWKMGSDLSSWEEFFPPSGPEGPQTQCATVAALRLLSASGISDKHQLSTAGYWAAGDGGGNRFYYDAGDSTTVDNGGSVIKDASNRRWKQIDCKTFNVRQWGAKGDGILGADATYINNAIAAAVVPVGSLNFTAVVYIPAGVYRTASMIGLKPNLLLRGEWRQTLIWADFPNAVAIGDDGTGVIYNIRVERINVFSNRTDGLAGIKLQDVRYSWFEKIQLQRNSDTQGFQYRSVRRRSRRKGSLGQPVPFL